MIDKSSGHKNIALWISLGTPLSLIVALAIGLISLLNFYVYQKTYKDINLARLSIVARDLRGMIELGLSLGLAPQANTELGGIVSNVKEKTEGIRFVVIIDEKGRRLNEVGDASSEQDWVKRLGGNSWLGEDSQSHQVGLPFRNSFGVVMGAVVIGYDKAALNEAVSAMRNLLVKDWFYAVTAVISSMLLGIWWLTRRLHLDLDHMEQMLGSSFVEAPSEVSLPSLGPDIERSLLAFIKKVHTTSEALSHSMKDVSKS